MNMTRTRGWIACQDQIGGRIMEACRKMYGHGKCIWMDERKGKVKIKDGKWMKNGRWKYGRCKEEWYGWNLPPV